MLRRVWQFFSEPKNLAALGLLGAAVAFLWKIAEPRLFPPVKPLAQSTSATADSNNQTAVAKGDGAQAINANAGAVVGNAAYPTPRDRTLSAVEGPSQQRAVAGEGANAVNASGNARVAIER